MKAPARAKSSLRPLDTFEEGTGYAPELLAERAAGELCALLRQRRYDRAIPAIVGSVAARAERCWAALPRWRARWTRAGRAGNPAPLLMFFRHWTAAAAVRAGFRLPLQVGERYALGLQPAGPPRKARHK
jgi:hypothetical protein